MEQLSAAARGEWERRFAAELRARGIGGEDLADLIRMARRLGAHELGHPDRIAAGAADGLADLRARRVPVPGTMH